MPGMMSHEKFEKEKANPHLFKFMKFCVLCNKDEDDDGDESKYTPHVSETVMEDWMDESIPDEDLSMSDITARLNGDTESIERCTVCGHQERVL